jgi:lipopolysaccharide export system permease protein
MKILTKYVLREHAAPFVVGIGAIVFLFVLNIVFRDLGKLLGKGVPGIVILEFFGLNLAWILALAVPMAVLIAAIMAFGRLSSDREIDAMKAGAVPVQRLISPIFLASAVLALLMVQFNNTLLPEFNHRLRMLYFDISKSKPTLTLDPNVFYTDIPNYTILAQKVDARKDALEGVYINDASDSRYNKTVIASRGRLDYYKESERIVFTLYDGEVHEVDKRNVEQYRRLKFEKESLSISVSSMTLERSTFQERGDREKSAGMLLSDIRRDRNILREREKAVLELIQGDMLDLFPKPFHAGLPDRSVKKPFVYHQNPALRVQRMADQTEGASTEIWAYRRSIDSIMVEVHKKYSIPVACLVFVLIGAPLGILVRQSGFGTAGWMSLVFFIVYWAFLIGGEQLADRRMVSPAFAMWSPNLLIGAAGVLLYLRTLRESTLFPWGKLSSVRALRRKT